MHYLDNDTDTLYRDSAEGYTLRLPANGWEAVAARLRQTPVTAAPVQEKKRRWLLWLLCACMVTGLTVWRLAAPEYSGKTAVTLTTARHNPETAANSGVVPQTVIPGKMNRAGVSYSKMLPVPAVKHKNAAAGGYTQYDITNYTPARPGVAADAESNYQLLTPSAGRLQPVKTPQRPLTGRNMTTFTMDVNTLNDAAKNLQRKTTPRPGWYMSLLAGPQWSQVKSQGLSRPGFSAGVQAGYRFGKKLSLEAGVRISEKKYFSSGSHFKMDKPAAGMPAGMEVISLTGSSTVVELPVTLKYDAVQLKNSRLFVTAGVSSYMLTSERNDYLAQINGARQQLEASYHNRTRYAAATINLGAGYEWTVHKKITARIEPYVQLPVQGIGVGRMPVSSAGIHLGLSLPLRR